MLTVNVCLEKVQGRGGGNKLAPANNEHSFKEFRCKGKDTLALRDGLRVFL